MHSRSFLLGFTAAVLVTLFAYGCPCQAEGGARQPGGDSRQRTLKFPPGQSLGMILLSRGVGSVPLASTREPNRRQVAGAVGTIRIIVPAHYDVTFEANRRVFENPELLNQISPDGIDELKLGFISMADAEDGMSDKVLKYVPHFKNLRRLNVARSETTDAGLSQLRDMPDLTDINCFLSLIDGSCFKQLALLPSLNHLSMPRCQLDQKNLAYLSGFPHLSYLNIENGHIDHLGMNYLSKCSNLVTLVLRGNKKIDDDCLKWLLPMKKLQELDLRGTAVTASGLKTLNVLKIRSLFLPSRLQSDVETLKLSFSSDIRLYFESIDSSVDRRNAQIYAPLK